MNVIHLSCWYPLTEKPNYGLYIKQQVAALHAHDQSGSHVLAAVVVTAGKSSFQSHIRHLSVEEDGIRGAVLEIRTRFWKTIYNNPPFLLQQFRQLYRHVADGLNPDLIHCHIAYPTATVARQLSRQLGVPYLVSDHWIGLTPHLQVHPLRHMTFKALMEAKAIVVPTRFMQQELMQVSQRHQLPSVDVVPPAVDATLFHYRAKEPKKQLNLVALSPLQKSKRLDLLVDAVAKLEERNIPCRLTIIGTGPYQKTLEARALDHHAPVRIVGRQTRKQIATHLYDADAALFASNYETYGPCLAEALSTGTPVFATDLPAWHDVIAPGFGQLIKPELDAWVSALAALPQTQYLYEAIAQFAAFRYAPEAVARQLVSIHGQALKG